MASSSLTETAQLAQPAGARWTLHGKRAVVTGGTKGIGRACVEELLALGAQVWFVARDAASVASCVEELSRQHPGRIFGFAGDVSSVPVRLEFLAKVQENWDAVDILVNNVGTNIRKPTVEYTEDEVHKILSTNLESVYHFCRIFHGSLRASGQGSIVNIGSVAGLTSLRTGTVYAMTKAAISQLTKNLACEWAKDGIRVNCVAPWYIQTPLAEPVLSKPDFLREVLARTPLGRVGQPSEISGIVAFLCMTPALFVTGQTIAAGARILPPFSWPVFLPTQAGPSSSLLRVIFALQMAASPFSVSERRSSRLGVRHLLVWCDWSAVVCGAAVAVLSKRCGRELGGGAMPPCIRLAC
eukprot:m.487866 g.487866  ORF g.487866 m.487866 type:complete len:355 (-) comp57231_c0_seq8:1091-2155(-)